MQEKVESTIKKMALWTSLIDRCKYDQFPNLKLFLETTSSSVNEDVKSAIKGHLQNLSTELRTYFPEISSQWNWVKDPFGNCCTDHLSISDQEQLIDISCNSRLKSCFAEESLINFWPGLQDIYRVSEVAIKYLLPFCTTYLCESGFSVMTNLKTKYKIEADQNATRLRAHLSH